MKNVLEWLETSESVFPDKAVYMEDSKEITFHDVLCASQKIGTALADVNGTAPIAVISGRKVETITAYLGIVYSGHAYAPIDGKLYLNWKRKCKKTQMKRSCRKFVET